MFLTSTFRLTFFDRALCAQCSVKKSQLKCGCREHLKILPNNIMTLTLTSFIPGTSRKIPSGPPPHVMNSNGPGVMGASTMPDGGPGLHGLSPPGYPQVRKILFN